MMRRSIRLKERQLRGPLFRRRDRIVGYRRLLKTSMFRRPWARPTPEEAPSAPQRCLGVGITIARILFDAGDTGPKDLEWLEATPHTRAEWILLQGITQRRGQVWQEWATRSRLVQPQGLETKERPLRVHQKAPDVLAQASVQARAKEHTRPEGVLEQVPQDRRRGRTRQRLCQAIPTQEDVVSRPSFLPI